MRIRGQTGDSGFGKAGLAFEAKSSLDCRSGRDLPGLITFVMRDIR